jgi:hypothetical protein
MRKAIWVNKAKSFEAAEAYDVAYYKRLSGAERIDTVQFLREAYFQAMGGTFGENGKRLRRILRIIKQA